MAAKLPRWIPIAGIATLGILVYTFTSGPPSAPARKANNSFQGRPASRTKGTELFRPEDYTAKFPPVNAELRDAFKPLVAKTTKTLTGQMTPLGENGIPNSFAGGEANWVYTGNAVVDGVPNALIENTSTQEGIFLRPGERWKSLTLARVTPNVIELLGPTGQKRTVRIAEDAATEQPVAATTPPGTAPGTLPAVTPNGRGAIAGPIGGTDRNAQVVGEDNRQNRRERRNRRNNPNNAQPAGTP